LQFFPLLGPLLAFSLLGTWELFDQQYPICAISALSKWMRVAAFVRIPPDPVKSQKSKGACTQ
jgi:hypothetical protein